MSVSVSVIDRGTRGKPVAAGLGPWLARLAPARSRGHVCVAILPDKSVRALNKRFRGIDKATDVLSFPAGSDETGPVRAIARGESTPLGEIVIARGVAAKQAKALGHALRTELRVLALHGLLHLLGYDHEVDKGQMARAEARLRRRAGLPSGLIARTS